MNEFWSEFMKIAPPTTIALLAIVFWLFRLLERRDEALGKLTETCHDIITNLARLTTLIELIAANGRANRA